jgi:hypothetical protein
MYFQLLIAVERLTAPAKLIGLGIIPLLTAIIPGAAQAGLVITSVSGGLVGPSSVSQTNGFTFTVGPADVSLTQLGHYDDNGDGLLAFHDVGIWLDGPPTSPLATATVPSGTSATLISNWRMVDITPITLMANTTYRLGSQVNGDQYTFGNPTVGPIDPLIAATPLLGVLRSGGGLNYPNAANAPTRINPNAFIIPAQSPPPTSVPGPLPVLGATAAFAWSRKLRSRIRTA